MERYIRQSVTYRLRDAGERVTPVAETGTGPHQRFVVAPNGYGTTAENRVQHLLHLQLLGPMTR